MRPWQVLVLALIGCRPSADDPIGSAKALVRLARGGECAETWRFYTRASQQVLEQRTKKSFGAVYANVPPEQQFKPHDWECARFSGYLPGSMREISRTRDTATIAVIWRTGTLVPIIPFLSSPRKDTPTQMQMTLENGAWKVIIQPPPENPRRHLVDVGKWTIDWPRNRANDRGGFSADGLMDADSEAAEAVFLDYDNWPKWIPFLVEARAISPVDSTRHQRVYGRYQHPGDTAGVDFVFNIHFAMLTRDHEYKGFGASWTIARDDLTPVPRGFTRLTSWGANLGWRVNQLVSGPAGLLIQHGWSGRPDEWPPALAQRVFTPEYAAQVMDGLEREARRRAAP